MAPKASRLCFSYLCVSCAICGPSLFFARRMKTLAAIRDPLVCQAQERVAAPAHLNAISLNVEPWNRRPGGWP